MQLKTLRRRVLGVRRALRARPASPGLREALRELGHALRARRRRERIKVTLARVNPENWPHY